MDPEDKRLLEASASGQTDRVLQLLEEPNGQQLHKFKDQDGKTVLHLAGTNGHSYTVLALIMNGADISAGDFVSFYLHMYFQNFLISGFSMFHLSFVLNPQTELNHLQSKV